MKGERKAGGVRALLLPVRRLALVTAMQVGQRRPGGGVAHTLHRYGNGARLRANCPVEDRRARPAIPRSMSFYDTCVAQRYRNGPTRRRRLTGAEAFELEGMKPGYIDIDGFRPKGTDSKGPESAPIAN
jgi:hypothetical protein